MSRAQQIYGCCAWNCLTADFRDDPESIEPAGAQEAYDTLLASGAGWVKLLHPGHKRADAEFARAHGLRVMVRAPGEGIVYLSDVHDILREFSGLVDWIELGNEPPVDDLWQHAWYMEYLADNLLTEAHREGIKLCTPGWTGLAEPPNSDSDLDTRIREVYSRFDAIGVHTYGEHVLDGHTARIQRWYDTFQRTIMLTEVGIAARDLVSVPPDPANYKVSSFIKAVRYSTFVRDCAKLGASAPYVEMVCFFIMGGPYHSEFSYFDVAGVYNPAGHRSYYLPKESWHVVGDNLG